MKRTTFLTLGLIVVSLVACKDKKKEETTTNEISSKQISLEETKAKLQTLNNIAKIESSNNCESAEVILTQTKFSEALQAKLDEQLLQEEIDYTETEVADVVEAAPRKVRTQEELLAKAKEAERWFETNYAKLIDDNVSNYEGVRVSIATDGTVTGVSLLNNGNWNANVKLLELLKTVLVTNHLELGRAISITVKNA